MQSIKDVGAEAGEAIWCKETETGSGVIEISVQSCKQRIGFFNPLKCAKNVTLRISLRQIRRQV